MTPPVSRYDCNAKYDEADDVKVLELEPASMKEGLWCFLVCSDGWSDVQMVRSRKSFLQKRTPICGGRSLATVW